MDAISPTSFARFNDALMDIYAAETPEALASVLVAYLPRLLAFGADPSTGDHLCVADEAILHELRRHVSHAHARLLRGAPTPAPPGPITRRERDIVIGVARGMSNAHIAAALSISQNTVKTHLKHLMTKLGAHNRAELVYAIFGAPTVP
jgi:DNA-binding NarL/FixJ family response regulator